MSTLTRNGTAEPVSRGQILRRGRRQGEVKFIFPCSVDHEQDWQPYPVDPYSCCMCDYTYIHRYIDTQRPRLDTDKFPKFSVGWTWQGFYRDLDPCWFE